MKRRLASAVATALPSAGAAGISHQFAPRLAVSPSSASRPTLAFSTFSSPCRPSDRGCHSLLSPRAPPAFHKISSSPSVHPRYAHDKGSLFTLFANGNDSDKFSLENSHEGAKHRAIRNNNSEAEGTSRTEESEKDVEESLRSLALGYGIAAFANMVAGVIFLWNVGTIANAASVASVAGPASNVLETARNMATRYPPNLLATYAAGALGHIFLVAGSCAMLSDSARTGKLRASDTCKRLTTGNLIFGLLGLFSLPGEPGCILLASPSSSTVCGASFLAAQSAKLVTALASFAGWEHGAGGFGSANRLKNIVGEIGRGCRCVWRTLPVAEERPATFYRTFFVLVTLGNLAFNVPELLFHLRNEARGLFSLPASLTIASSARLGLLSTMLYVLKDAAERKRLEGTAFIGLNMMVGLWAFGVGIAQGFADGPASLFNVRRAADKLLFGLLFLNNGVLSQLSKMGIIRNRERDYQGADPPLRI